MERESPSVTVCSDLNDLSREAGALFVQLANQAVEERGQFTVCLSGGSTPRQTYALLTQEPLRSQTPWSQVHIFWGDERVISPDHPDNHHQMASDILFSKVPIPPDNIHRMCVENGDSAGVAREYEILLRSFFNLAEGELPRFDLILLGMGADAHMASLFPGTSGLKERRSLVAAHYVPKLAADRLTLTVPVLNNARNVVFLVSGVNKAEALQLVLQGDDPQADLPARLLRPMDGNVIWMVDKDAASKLNGSTITRQPEVFSQ